MLSTELGRHRQIVVTPVESDLEKETSDHDVI